MYLEAYPVAIQGLFAAAITLLAGASLFVHFLNRKLSHVEFLPRFVLAGAVGVICLAGLAVGLAVGTGALAGNGLKAALLLPGAILTLLLLGEARLVGQRWRYRAPPPARRESFTFDGEKLQPGGRAESKPAWHPLKTTDLRLATYVVEVSGLPLPPGSQGEQVRVVQLSDFHFSPRLPYAYFRQAVELAMAQSPDLVLLTGDFVTFAADAERLPALFAGLSGRLGVFATLGNHDYWAGSQEVIAALRRAGIPLITNDCVRLPLWEGVSLRLCGNDDPWGSPPWVPPQLNESDLNLIISHSADNIYRLCQYPFRAVFSGHFHAGQVRIPGFGALVVPSRYGRRFDHGHFSLPNRTLPSKTSLFVSAGVGSATPLLRIYCQPDLFVVNFMIKSR